jgi:hypothetical protein
VNSGNGALDVVSAAPMPWATAGDIATATKALASGGRSRAAAASDVAGARERLARHVSALALVRQQRDELPGAGWGR